MLQATCSTVLKATSPPAKTIQNIPPAYIVFSKLDRERNIFPPTSRRKYRLLVCLYPSFMSCLLISLRNALEESIVIPTLHSCRAEGLG